MQQVKVTLAPDEYRALVRLSEAELRNVADQLRMILRRELEQRRLLPSQVNAQRPQPQGQVRP